MTGFIYVMTNPDIKGLVKIGFTKNSPEKRARELAGTGVPRNFEVAYHLKVLDPIRVEKLTHQHLSEYHHSKEWFNCDVSLAIETITNIVGKKSILEQQEEAQQKEDKLYRNYCLHFLVERKKLEEKIKYAIKSKASYELDRIRRTTRKTGFLGIFGEEQHEKSPQYKKVLLTIEKNNNLASIFIKSHLKPCLRDVFTSQINVDSVKSEMLKKQIVKAWNNRRNCKFTWEHITIELRRKTFDPWCKTPITIDPAIEDAFIKILNEPHIRLEKNSSLCFYV